METYEINFKIVTLKIVYLPNNTSVSDCNYWTDGFDYSALSYSGGAMYEMDDFPPTHPRIGLIYAYM